MFAHFALGGKSSSFRLRLPRRLCSPPSSNTRAAFSWSAPAASASESPPVGADLGHQLPHESRIPAQILLGEFRRFSSHASRRLAKIPVGNLPRRKKLLGARFEEIDEGLTEVEFPGH